MKVSTIWFGVFIGMVGLVEINQAVDPVTGTAMVGEVLDGANKLADLVTKLDDMFIKPITDKVNEEIAKIDVTMDGLKTDEKKLVEDARLTLVRSRHDIQRTRTILTVLADETISRCGIMVKVLKVILKTSSPTAQQKRGVNLVARKMKDLLERSKVLLKDAIGRYESGQIQLKVVQEKLRIFSERVIDLADSNSARHKRESDDLRMKVYLSCMAGCLFPPACPVIYAAAAGIVESEIKRWKRRLDAAKAVCIKTANNANALVTKIDGELVFMQEEEKLVFNWESKISMMYDDYKLGDVAQNAIDMEEFDQGYSINQLLDLVKACQAFKAHAVDSPW